MNDTILGLSLILAALLVAILSHREKRRRATMRRVLDYPIDMFPREPRERYTLTPLDTAIVHDLVKGCP